MKYPKRLIEVDLPIKRISAHARREKSIRHGHISTLHIWWARRPLASCRAVICAALWPDPFDDLCPQTFRDKAAEIITDFANKVMSNKDLANKCSEESLGRWMALSKGRLDDLNTVIVKDDAKDTEKKSEPLKFDTRNPTHLNVLRFCLLDFIADFANWDCSTVPEYLDTARALTQIAHESLGGEPGTRPLVVDPFAGGGSIPLEALRVGADAFASDLNPVAVLLNKVVLEYIPKYGKKLAEEVRKWGNWIKEEAEKELAEFYPKDPDGATPIAYLWARTITCEGPGCGAEVPLMRSLWLAKKGTKSVAFKIIPKPELKKVDFEIIENVKVKDVGDGTVRRGSATCPCCGYTNSLDKLKQQFRKRLGGTKDARLICIILETNEGKKFRNVTLSDIRIILSASKLLEKLKSQYNTDISFVPNEDTQHYHSFVNRASVYGFNSWEDFYTIRQLLILGKLCESIRNLNINYLSDKLFIIAIKTLLAFAIDRSSDYWSSLATWAGDFVGHTFGRQAIPFVWDFAEVNPFSHSTGNWLGAIDWIVRVIERESIKSEGSGQVVQSNAAELSLPYNSINLFITDPPYYYAVQYADLSDYFYVWLKRSIGKEYQDLLSELETPKKDEAIVQSPNDENKKIGKNRVHYERIMFNAFKVGNEITKSNGMGIIVFANATTEGWESLLISLISTGWIITGSWPIDTERPGRVISSGRSVLASSIHLVCRPRETVNSIGDWRQVLQQLPIRIHEWLPRLAQEGIVGADAIFACLGPALEIFSQYSSVEKASGEQVTLKNYLEEVWAAVSKEALNMIFEGAETTSFEEDARLTAMWLWTLSTGNANNTKEEDEETEETTEDEDEESTSKTTKLSGFILEYDAARKIAQGLGAHLEQLKTLVEIKGNKARLLPVAERARTLFGKEDENQTKGKKTISTPPIFSKKPKQLGLFTSEPDQLFLDEQLKKIESDDDKDSFFRGKTLLDKVHQSMILFASGRSDALKRFLVEEGIGKDPKFWKLAQAFSALYPKETEEKRWVDGVMAKKKGLGF